MDSHACSGNGEPAGDRHGAWGIDPAKDGSPSGAPSPFSRAVLPETYVTAYSGHMGDTFALTGGGMPWKECHVMDERLRFVARLLEGENDGAGVASGDDASRTRRQSLTSSIARMRRPDLRQRTQ